MIYKIKRVKRQFLIFTFSAFFIWLLLNFAPLQNRVAKGLEEAIFDATGLPTKIGHVSFELPSTLIVHNLLIKNTNDAPLLEAHLAILHIDLLSIIEKKTRKCRLHLEGKLEHHLLELNALISSSQQVPLTAHFNAIIDHHIPLNGTFTLSKDLLVDGSSFHLGSTSISTFQSLLKTQNISSYNIQGDIQGLCTLSGFLSSPNAQVEITSNNLIINGLNLNTFSAQTLCNISKEDLTADIHLSGMGLLEEEPFALDANCSWKNLYDDWEIKLHRCSGNAFSFPFQLLEPTKIHKEGTLYTLAPCLLSFGGGTIESSISCAEEDLTGWLSLKNLSIPSFPLKLDGELDLSGNVDAFKLEGTLTHGSDPYEVPGIGVSLKNLLAHVEMAGNRLHIKHIEAIDGKLGKITGHGFFLIDEKQLNPFTLELSLEETELLNQDYMQAVCNGSLTLQGNNLNGSLTGQLEVSNGDVTIPERSHSTINSVEVTYLNVPKDAPQPQSLSIQKTAWPLSLNVQLKILKTLSIKGPHLASIWRGNLVVQGTAETPLLFGDLKITEGQYLFNGNPFSLSQGTINFAGEVDKKTTLYVIASRDLDRVKVDVIAKGAIKSPTLSFRSNPPLQQREILSWILFNRGTSEISPFQGSQLSESITNLSTNQEGPDVLAKIRSTLGIDRFEIGGSPNSASNVNLHVGKYISDNILISVIKNEANRLAIEAALTEKIKLQAQVGDDSQGQLLLKWKRDY